MLINCDWNNSMRIMILLMNVRNEVLTYVEAWQPLMTRMVADWPMTTRRTHSQLVVHLMLHLTLSKIHIE
jgi:hypothetical protein